MSGIRCAHWSGLDVRGGVGLDSGREVVDKERISNLNEDNISAVDVYLIFSDLFL